MLRISFLALAFVAACGGGSSPYGGGGATNAPAGTKAPLATPTANPTAAPMKTDSYDMYGY